MPFSEVTKKTEWFAAQSCAAVIKALQTDANKGLTSTEANTRLQLLGRNELEKEPPTPLWRLVLDQFADLIVGILCLASLISFVLGEYVEAIAIISIVLINALIGVIQESKAEAALDALKSMSTSKARVLRDGQAIDIDSAELVQGDVVMLEMGMNVPADIRLISSIDFQCREMALTGEPEPVKKDAQWVGPAVADEDESGPSSSSKSKDAKEAKEEKEDKLTPTNIAFQGCEINNGRGVGVVVKTGMKTAMGDIADMLNSADAGPSPLQQRLEHLGEQLGVGALIICGIVFAFGMFYGDAGSAEHGGKDQPLWLQMLLTSVSLAVAAVPEGLPAAVTITLALGMRDMVKRNALIRNLHSVETLGCISTICTDKTGTITTGCMTTVRLWAAGSLYQITGAGFDPKGHVVPLNVDRSNEAQVAAAAAALAKDAEASSVLRLPLMLSVLCSNASLTQDPETKQWKTMGNASECPLIVAAAKQNLSSDALNAAFHRLKENPFQSERKMMSVLSAVGKVDAEFSPVFAGKSHVAIVKGAPNFVLAKCHSVQTSVSKNKLEKLTAKGRQDILDVIDNLSSQALRVLAIAYKTYTVVPKSDGAEELEEELVLAGLVASIDPERPEVPAAIAAAHQAGIRVVMITGDYEKTARAIAENIAIIPKNAGAEKSADCEVIRPFGERLRKIEDLLKSASDAEAKLLETEKASIHRSLDKITAECDVFARAKPEDKYTIVQSLQRQGQICSMTGDGVNDAISLKAADVGIAMGISGTDVAKAASAVVLTDDNFASIVGAIEQGRIIYSNIQKFVFFLLSCNIAEVLIIFFCIIAGLASPLDPIQLLMMNLATDGLPALALSAEPGSKTILKEAPRPKKEPIVDRIMFVGIVIQSFATTGVVLAAYIIGLYIHSPNDIYTKDEALLAAPRTCAFLVMSLCEIIRAYTVRHNRLSVFSIGVFSNWVMQVAVGVSALIVLACATLPGIQDIFHCIDISMDEWKIVLVLSLIPAIIEEITKFVYRLTGFGLRVQQVYVASESKKTK